jgi:hypothetical protein
MALTAGAMSSLILRRSASRVTSVDPNAAEEVRLEDHVFLCPGVIAMTPVFPTSASDRIREGLQTWDGLH